MRELNLEVTPVFLENLQSKKPIVINRGGTRSSKTYSLSQLYVLKLISEPNKRMLISRKTFPALRTSAMENILETLKAHHIYDESWHNKTEHTFVYPPTGSKIYFIAIDDEQKIRGPEWNYAWFNEANEMTYDDFKQVYMRLSASSDDGKMNQFFLDFNPSDETVWINHELEQSTQYDYDLIHSTYQDNTFLPDSARIVIENMSEHDPEYWKIYGQGKYGKISGQILRNWDTVDTFPAIQHCKWVAIGLDFGFSNHPTAILKASLSHGDLYWEGLCYRTAMTNQMISQELERLEIPQRWDIIADSAEPKSIAEIQREGWNVRGAKKGRDSVNYGLDLLRQYTIHVVDNDDNLKRELRSYRWKSDPQDSTKLLNTPIDRENHYIDAGRYVAMQKLGKRQIATSPSVR